jgi:hypothetical protein
VVLQTARMQSDVQLRASDASSRPSMVVPAYPHFPELRGDGIQVMWGK